MPKSFASVLPGVFSALLPKCPLCLPLYACLFSLLGIHKSQYDKFLFPLIMLCLLLSVFLLGKKAQQQRRPATLLLALAGAVLVLFSKCYLASRLGLACGIFLMLAASLRRPACCISPLTRCHD